MGPCSYADCITLFLFHHSDSSFLDYWFRKLPEHLDTDMEDPEVADRVIDKLHTDLEKRAVLISYHEATAIQMNAHMGFSSVSDEVSYYLELYLDHDISDYRPISIKRVTFDARPKLIHAIDEILFFRDQLRPEFRANLEGVRAVLRGAAATSPIVSWSERET